LGIFEAKSTIVEFGRSVTSLVGIGVNVNCEWLDVAWKNIKTKHFPESIGNTLMINAFDLPERK
jgi:hypothetical protein